MTREEYLTLLGRLRMSQEDCGKFFGVHPVTGKRWAIKGPPPPVAKFLRYMLAKRLSRKRVDEAIARLEEFRI